MNCTETHSSCHIKPLMGLEMSEWLTAWVCKDLCMLLNLEPQWKCCQRLSCLLFEVAHYVILDPNLDKRWTHSCFAVLSCSWGQRRYEEVGWIFLFLLQKIGGPACWTGSWVLRSTIGTFPVNFDLALLNYLVAIWKENLGFMFHDFLFGDFLFSGGSLV